MALSIQMEDYDLEKALIIGGGIAGLTCLNALLDYGISAELYEGLTVGSPKMCGEFIGPQTVSLLQKWDIDLVYSVSEVDFSVKHHHIKIPLQQDAGAISRSSAETLLALRAKRLGGTIIEETFITDITPPSSKHDYFTVKLSSGIEKLAKTIFFATGKLSFMCKPKQHAFVGIKMHFPKPVWLEGLHMYGIKGGYMGLVPISHLQCNFASLVRREVIEQPNYLDGFINLVRKNNPYLAEILQEVDFLNHPYIQVKTPKFGMQKQPGWPNAFWIGDALASLYPAIGTGFTHSMVSALAAVEDYVNKSTQQRQKYLTKLRKKIWLGVCMHQLMSNPKISIGTMKLFERNRWLSQLIEKNIFSHL